MYIESHPLVSKLTFYPIMNALAASFLRDSGASVTDSRYQDTSRRSSREGRKTNAAGYVTTEQWRGSQGGGCWVKTLIVCEVDCILI